MQNRAGISLLEVVIALTLVAFAAHAVATTLAHATRWQRLASTRLEQLDDLRAVVALETARPCTAPAESLSLRHPIDREIRDSGDLRQITLRVHARADTTVFTTLRSCP